MPKLLMLLANPRDSGRLRMDKEMKEINQLISYSSSFDFTCLQVPAINFGELPELLLREKPDILHFSGHGMQGVLSFEDPNGNSKEIDKDALTQVIEEAGLGIICLFLNACASTDLAKQLSAYIPFTIGFPDRIDDEIARNFSTSFYVYLSYGKTIRGAFKLACATISPQIDREKLPILFENDNAESTNKPIFNPPILKAEFELNKKGSPQKEEDSYRMKIYLEHIPSGTNYIIYEFIDDSIKEKHRFDLIEDLNAGSFTTWTLYGNVTIRCWFWMSKKKKGFGIDGSLIEALDNCYGKNLPKNFEKAYEDLKRN